MTSKALLHGAKDAKQEGVRKPVAVLAQPKADPSSVGGLARKTLLNRFVDHFIGKNLK